MQSNEEEVRKKKTHTQISFDMKTKMNKFHKSNNSILIKWMANTSPSHQPKQSAHSFIHTHTPQQSKQEQKKKKQNHSKYKETLEI